MYLTIKYNKWGAMMQRRGEDVPGHLMLDQLRPEIHVAVAVKLI